MTENKLEVTGAYFSNIGDDGYGVFLSHNLEKAEQKLLEIQQTIDDAEKWRITRRSGDSSVLIPCETLDELKEKAEKYDKLIFEIQDQPHTGTCNVVVNYVLKQENQQLKDDINRLSDIVQLRNNENFNLKEKLEKIEKIIIDKTNSTPRSFEESQVKMFAHKIRDILRPDELKQIFEDKEVSKK